MELLKSFSIFAKLISFTLMSVGALYYLVLLLIAVYMMEFDFIMLIPLVILCVFMYLVVKWVASE